MDPTNPNTLYVGVLGAASGRRGGSTAAAPNGGIFKTTDGGKTFKKLTNGTADGRLGQDRPGRSRAATRRS